MFIVVFQIDPYVSKQLQVAYKRGVVDYFVGIYKILVGIVGLLGLLLVWIARHAIYNSHTKQKPVSQEKISRRGK